MVVVVAVSEVSTDDEKFVEEEDEDPPVATSPSVWGMQSMNVSKGPATMLSANCTVRSLRRGCASVLFAM